MSILCYKLSRNEKETRGFVNGLGSETLAKKKIILTCYIL